MYVQYTSPLCALYLRLRLLGRLWSIYCVPQDLMYAQYTSTLCALRMCLGLLRRSGRVPFTGRKLPLGGNR